MDYEDIIKLEQQSPHYSTGKDSNSYKHCMASFYDNDSECDGREDQDQVHISEHMSVEKAIDYVQNYVDLIDTPLEDVLDCLQRLQCVDGLDRTVLKKKILKRKNLLKRYRAKNRQPRTVMAYEQFTVTSPVTGTETEAEIKKKRNRVSAQISRDRKKQYFKELEQKNQKLQEQIIRTRLENQKLKKQIQNVPMRPKNRFFSDTVNNKLTKLLIFLGIICLIGMLKQTFFSTKDSLSKLNMPSKMEDFNQFSGIHHTKMIEESQRKVAEFLEEPQLEAELLDTEERKVSFETDPPINGNKRLNMFSTLIQRLTDMKESIDLKNIQL